MSRLYTMVFYGFLFVAAVVSYFASLHLIDYSIWTELCIAYLAGFAGMTAWQRLLHVITP